MSKVHFTFEQLCIRNEKGYSFDLGTMFLPSNPNSFDDVVFKLISKIDTSLLLLDTHNVEIEDFTIISLPISSHDITDSNNEARAGVGRKPKNQNAKNSVLNLSSLQNAWEYLSGGGWHGLQSLALLNMESMPMNGSRKYSLYQYITCIMDVIRANYMFQKFKPTFYNETMEVFDDDDIKNATQAVFGLLWRRGAPPLKQTKVLNTQMRKRSCYPITSPIKRPMGSRSPKAQQTFKENNNVSDDDIDEYDDEEEQQMEVDDEISFKNPLPDFEERVMAREENTVSSSQRRTGRKSKMETSLLSSSPAQATQIPSPAIVPDPQNINDITLGFELGASTPGAAKGPRKSMGRKSLSSEWPEDERHDILDFYDNLNPDATEQKRIALTCKYVSLYMDKELPSKLLYQWIQKKGRENLRTVTTFTTPEGEQQKQAALKVFRDLNDSSSETARVNYTLKYLDVQYGLNINSKQLYDWISEKTTAKKGAKRR